MALQFIEGFERYRLKTPALRLASRYTCSSLGSSAFVAGRTGGYALSFCGTTITYPSLEQANSYTFGFAFKDAGLSGTNPIFSMNDVSTAQITIHYNASTRVFSVKKGATTLGTGSAVSTGWHYVEIKATIGTSNAVDVHVDEVSDISLTGVNTQSTGNAYVSGFSFHGTENVYLIDDIYAFDDSNFLGIMVVEGLRPYLAGTNSSWSTGSTPNFSAVAELDNRFVYASDVDTKDTYVVKNLTRISDSILGVCMQVETRNTDDTSHDVSSVVLLHNSEEISDAQTVSAVNDRTLSFLYEVNPVTTDAWTVADVNESQFGINLDE